MNSPVDSIVIPNFNFHFAPWMLWSALWAFLIVYAIISVILFYHWIAYGMRNKGVLLAELVFPLGSTLFIYMAILGIATL